MGRSFSKILVANRGEIAVRIIRACREMGIASVAVYSDADHGSMHVRMADEALHIGPAPALESYLSIAKIVEAALRSGAEAIHPGYGFLSENAAFAEAVEAAGLVFIGPSPAAMRAMGDKAAARAAMEAAGVPVVPGYHGLPGSPPSDEELAAAASRIGYPLLVKATAGGGGRGMRVVTAASGLAEGLAAARREALHAFGDGTLFVERYIARAHHVEIQVLGDSLGNLVHLFERECSVQRRHQKIIEESPSALLDEELRSRMGEAAVRAAKAAGYSNAGTVEFIVDPATRGFYFLEMNTRLQVEHPVTESVTGLDLVRWQIRVAEGAALPFTQEELRSRGHAIECRLYAEDPSRGFLPTGGRLLRFAPPSGPGIRVDSGFAEGDTVGLHYDPLLAKIIAYAEDRPTALARMREALRRMAVLGIVTNWEFLRELLDEPDFEEGRVHTTWIEERLADWKHSEENPPPEFLAAAAFVFGAGGSKGMPPNSLGQSSGGHRSAGLASAGSRDSSGEARPAADGGSDPFSPWQSADAFRSGGK
ncbi:MAG TPA: acetyl-CoA carboxylase biotin carboxylase subunit [Rectinemataceae bacterium]|nr:acetyl-CoA carboxylase biotin carboxylase subunit [Rectinemataceae bacterium]